MSSWNVFETTNCGAHYIHTRYSSQDQSKEHAYRITYYRLDSMASKQIYEYITSARPMGYKLFL
jgi:hypothetical protein